MHACVAYDAWKNGLTLPDMTDDMYTQEIGYWTAVLTRITDVTLTLACCDLAFQGHREKLGEPNSGNFLSIIDLLIRYDPVLKGTNFQFQRHKTFLAKIHNGVDKKPQHSSEAGCYF